MNHANTSGSATSNISFSMPISSMNFAGTSVRQASTFSVMPSLSIIMIFAPASKTVLPARSSNSGRVCPQPLVHRRRRSTHSKLNPHFRFRFQSGLAHEFISRNQSSVGIETNPAEISMTSKLILLHFANVFANRVASLDQHTLDKSTRGNKHLRADDKDR